MTYDPHDYTTWDWRAEYREADPVRGHDGEWQVNAYEPGKSNEESGWVCSLGGGHVPEDEKAAAIISAGPDLLEALKSLHVAVVNVGGGILHDLYQNSAMRGNVERAIAKAEGRAG